MVSRSNSSSSNEQANARQFVSIFWRCCQVYSRVYKNASNTAYEGKCPRCGGRVSLPVGEGGTTRRSFIAE